MTTSDSDFTSGPDRTHDIVVYGVTGFVGKLTAKYLAEHAPADTRIALAGRSTGRIEAARKELGPTAQNWPVIEADAADTAALRSMAESTRVVITTVGPYAKYGMPLATACAEAGTDYVDLTGEVLFARESIDTNHEIAQRTGARIVHSCGFDSVPSDIGVHALYEAVTADNAGELTNTTLVVTSMSGGVSGGTVDSLRGQIEAMKKDKRARRIAARPYSLSPDRSLEPQLGRQLDTVLIDGKKIDPSLRGWKAPFVMASYNTRVVRRTNALRDWAYGKQFRYSEVMSVGSSVVSPVLAGALSAGLFVGVSAMTVLPGKVLDRILPKPGSGPSEKAREKGHFTVDLYTLTTSGARYRARVKASGDPGYKATAVMLAESALALVLGGDALPKASGVLTPATAMGDVLVDRLNAAGMEIWAKRN